MDGNKRARRRRHSGVERLKSLLIVLLTLTALGLTLRVLMFNGLAGQGPRGWLSDVTALFRPEQAAPTADADGPGQVSAAAQPVRMAVYDGAERFAVQYDAEQTDRLFTSLGILLTEALSSASAPEAVGEEVWREALCSPGVWFDFLGEIPLEALYAWMGEGGANPSLTACARQLAVARDGEGRVCLYYSNVEDGLYYACGTQVAFEGHMDEMIAGYGGSGASFVFELEADSGYDGVDPYVLIPSSPPSPVVYRASNPLAGMDSASVAALQEALSFQAPSDALYAIPGGARLRVGRETLEVGGDGTVTYHTSEDEPARYPVGEDCTVTELVEFTRRLAADTVGRSCGAARLYLMGVDALADGSTEVRFGYSLNGSAVLLPEDGCAARFTVRSGQITDFTLRFRAYEATGEHSLLLPERQAAAALGALRPEGRELALCYTDSGGDTVQAGWAAR